ncbi:relaxase/mobilization nuclease domain-containing protein [Puia dinghuensis]|uniref:Mobilization protein n=1 Tax=Puia dinghuensis TaxID=1792502 RepID=A0A8J2UIQ0_9BACT|nr:relaxase/mobilization nuclease domain-containing protein [Puia dinghuensis]GGB23932.1 mobilization protein [Puia dinghuensis]
MHANVQSSPSIAKTLNYHEQKMSERVAECIAAENFVKDRQSLTREDIEYSFKQRLSLHDTIQKPVFHPALQFGKGEKIADATLAAIGREYMEGMGFGDQPYLIYRHSDAPRTHVHLVSPKIDREGEIITITKELLQRSQELTRALERKYGLQTEYGERHAAMSQVLDEVIPYYSYTNLGELNAVLRLHHMEVNRGKEGTLTWRKRGLHYHILNADGVPEREYYPARRFSVRPTLTNLEKRFVENQSARERHRSSLTSLIDYALTGKPLSLEALKQALAKRQVSVVVREEKEAGRQVWFVDQLNKTVFEGDSLGREYSLAALEKRLVPEETYRQQIQQRVQEQNQRQNHRYGHSH